MRHIVCPDCGTFFEASPAQDTACPVCSYSKPVSLLKKQINVRSRRNSNRGQSHSREYVTWQQMKGRCLNQNHEAYPRYGGRGISICTQWIASFETFQRDMGPRPDGYTIERLDNDGNYEPDNCVWATRRDQNRNKGNTVWIELNGERKILADWCAELKLNPWVVSGRLRKGWSHKQALLTPMQKKRKRSAPQPDAVNADNTA